MLFLCSMRRNIYSLYDILLQFTLMLVYLQCTSISDSIFCLLYESFVYCVRKYNIRITR